MQSQISANIWRVDLDGAKDHARILAPSTREQIGPFISPDGRRVVFTSNRSGINEIWVCDSDGGNRQQLTSLGNSMTGTPRWSSDGKQIVFDSRVGGEAIVYVMDANGGVPRKLETGTRMNSLPSSWRDGRWIYFASGLTDYSLTVWHHDAGTRGLAVQLTKTASSMSIESPDGRYPHHLNSREGKIRLWRVPTEQGAVKAWWMQCPPSAQTATNGGLLNQAFIFTSHTGIKTELDFLDLRTSRIHRIYTFDKPPYVGLSVSPDGKWLLYSRTDEAASD